jgi:prolipoprotein diacylglyceryltransferase
VRAYALGIVTGVIVAMWVAERRYKKAGGRRGLILDVAAWAVPAGLIGAGAHGALAEAARLFPSRPEVWATARAWVGVIGVPGAIGLGAIGAWIACRRARVRLGPVAGAAAPGVAFAEAIVFLSGWFSQRAYGRPSALPWAVEISPVHRVPGYENFATFQPVFGYEAIWCVAAGFAVIWAGQRLALPGERAFALALALTCAGTCAAEWLLINPAPRFAGLRADQWTELITAGGAAAYLYRSRHRHGPDVIVPVPPGGHAAPRSSAHGAHSAP